MTCPLTCPMTHPSPPQDSQRSPLLARQRALSLRRTPPFRRTTSRELENATPSPYPSSGNVLRVGPLWVKQCVRRCYSRSLEDSRVQSWFVGFIAEDTPYLGSITSSYCKNVENAADRPERSQLIPGKCLEYSRRRRLQWRLLLLRRLHLISL